MQQCIWLFASSSSFFIFHMFSILNTFQLIDVSNKFIPINMPLHNKIKIKFLAVSDQSKRSQIMDKIKEKQLAQLKEEYQKQKETYRHALDQLLHNQTLKILIEYSKQQLKTMNMSQIQNINDYTPISISRLIFAKQLKQIKQEVNKLPNSQCPLDLFLIIMLKAVKFPFEKTPFYLLGLKEMFRQIKENEKDEYVSFEQIQSYVMGEVVNFNDETQHDTEFEIQFTQNKMQDFLMHDNGIRKIIYSHDLKKYMVLDQNSKIIKIYDQNMKMIGRFEPNKDKHNKKHPTILTFDYNQFGSKLGISLNNNTFSIVHLGNFLSASSEEAFRSVFLNQIVYKSQSPIVKINFLSMMNRWLCVDQQNEIWIYDMENYKQDNENYCKKFKHPNDDYEIKSVHEFVSLAAVAFVINNDIWFFNETLSKKKFKKFSHCEQINKFIYSQEKNQFYLVGKDQKYITIFTLNKINGQPNKIWTFLTNQIIADFDIFPFHNSLLILDFKNNLKVYSLDQFLFQYQQNYDLIVKKNQLSIKLLKFSKTSFLIHATYILVMELKKVAIEKDSDFVFQETFFYDSNKEEIVFSVNGQIIGLSLMHGQIRKSIAPQNSNLDKHKAFHMSKNAQPFVVDQKDSLYQILYKTNSRYKEFKDYRKHVGITDIKKSFYDEDYRMVIMISDASIYMVRNDSQNNFTFKSCLLLENSPLFIKYKYNQNSKQLIFLDATNVVYIMKSYNFNFDKIIKLSIFKEWNEGEKMAIDVDYNNELDILMILTNNGEFVLFRPNDPSKSIYVKVKEFLPYKLQSTQFTSFSYQKGQTERKQHQKSRIFFYNQMGFLIEFELDQMLSKIVNSNDSPREFPKIVYIKQTHQIDFHKLLASSPPQHLKLQKSSLFKIQPSQSTFIKVHDKAIVFSKRIFLEQYNLLTIGEDGHIKLWGDNRKVYFDLKLPLMLKIEWNMNEIHQKRNLRIITETNQFLDLMTQIIKENEGKEILHMNHKKKLKNKSQKIKINLDNPIALEFQNKQLQEIVMDKKDFQIQNKTIDVISKERRLQVRRMNMTQRITEPWKKKSQFKKILDNASPIDKYMPKFKEKMPFDLLLMRNDLQMDQSIAQITPSKAREKAKKQQLNILPELKNYYKSKEIEVQKEKSIQKKQQNEEEQPIENYNPENENKFETCLFVKTQRGPKKGNAFDEIDKYFWRKEQEILNKKWIPKKSDLRKNLHSLEPKLQHTLIGYSMRSSEIGKVDPVKQIIKIFEEHNKQTIHDKKGRLIKIPRIQKSAQRMQVKKM